MAVRIPTEQDLGRRAIPQGGRAIVPSTAGQARTAAIGVGMDVWQMADQKNDRENYARARSQLLQADIAIRKELENDPDFATHEERYRTAMEKAQDEAASMVKDRRDRVLFGEAAKVDTQRGALEVFQNSKRLEGDQGRASLDTNLEGNRTAALNARDPATRGALAQATREQIEGAVKKGWVSREAGAATWQKWQQSYAEGYAAMLEPEEREKVLRNPKGTPAEFIAPDRRAALLRAAEGENKETRVRGQAQGYEDSIFAAGGSLESMRAKARKIEDPDVRDSVIARLEARANDRINDMNRNDALNRRAAWDVIAKGGKWEDIEAGLASRLDPEDAVRIKDYLAKGGNVETNRETWYKLNQLAGDNPKQFAELDLLEYRNALDDGDFEAFAKLQEGIKADVRQGDPVATENQLVAGSLKAMGIDPNAKAGSDQAQQVADFRYAFARKVNDQFRATGKPLSFDDKQAIADKLMIEVRTQGDNDWFSSKKRLFEVDQGERVLEVIVPKDARAQIVAALKKRNIAPTEEKIQELYVRGVGAR